MSLEQSLPLQQKFSSPSIKAPSKKRVLVIGILGLIVVVLGLVGIKGAQIFAMINAGKAWVPPPEAVTSAKVEKTDWEGARSAIGTLVAIRGVTLGSEVSGAVRDITFESGSSVKRGAVLVRLDTTLEQAQLESAKADAALAQQTLARAKALREGGANTPADLEAAETRGLQAQAAVDSILATLSKKTIRAPFDGRISIRQVELGQILAPGSAVASLQSVDPIYAEFSLPQQALADIKEGQRVRLHTDTFPGESWEGEVAIINPEVDIATRNVRFRATLTNKDGRLRPGMFANIEVLAKDKHEVVAIPATSVIFAPYGDSVFTIEDKPDAATKATGIVHQKFVRLGERRGDFVAVVSGLTPGETVVSNGAFKLRNGVSVTVNNTGAPANHVAPAPADP